ncbi:uncharacterized protein LOC127722206 [Mytilus californianus]|uniref:uncharacterized protein LOC127722206 n=1 Tax=Mytilus californianus TaxID=6549 RepID=UPI0022483FEE|nr:uncharacterized protein LOC127722206 [Mytilus californianus]
MGTNNIVSLTESPSVTRLNESNIHNGILNGTVTGQDDLMLKTELSIQDQVIIGACVTVAFLSIIAIILRLCMPMIRKQHKVIQTECKYTEQVVSKEKRYGQLPYKGLSSSSSSQSSSWSSNSQLDWSDSSSNNTRSTYYTSESKNMSRPLSNYNFRGSTSSLPLYISDNRSMKSNASSYLKYINEDPTYILNNKSLEPLKLDDVYRGRWDEEFDPLQVTPSGSLASLSHPSEDRNVPSNVPDFSAYKQIPHNPSLARVHSGSKKVQSYRM